MSIWTVPSTFEALPPRPKLCILKRSLSTPLLGACSKSSQSLAKHRYFRTLRLQSPPVTAHSIPSRMRLGARYFHYIIVSSLWNPPASHPVYLPINRFLRTNFIDRLEMGLKIIIVGGSLSGLSLASMLEWFDIDYVVLEGHAKIAPQLGASLGLLPSGLRILDQLGCYEAIQETAGNTYYKTSMRLFGGGSWIDPKPVTFSKKLEDRYVFLTHSVQTTLIDTNRIGYPQIFIDRQAVIQILLDKIRHKDRILSNKRVVRIEHGKSDVTVVTSDGSTYTGDFVVGADGIHSTVREEMWRVARDEGSKKFQSDPISGL